MAAHEISFTRGERVAVRGEHWTVVNAARFDDCTVLTLHGAGDTNINARRTLLAPFDRVRSLASSPRLRAVRPRRWLHALRRAACEVRPFGGLTALLDISIDLLPYQLEPAIAVLRDGATRILIADGVGLGKTIQSGILLAELYSRDEGTRALVLAPAGLRAQWSRELAAHFRIEAVAADSAWLARSARELPPDINPWLLPGVYIASYDFMKRPEVLRAVEDLTWDALIVDEAHNATRGSARLCAVDAVASRARRVVLLTATPHSGSSTDFEALCGIGTPDSRADPILLFQRRHDRLAGHPRRTTILGIRPTHAERRMHRLLEAYSREVCREAARRGDAQARLAVIVLRKRALSSAGSFALSARRRLDLLAGTIAPGSLQLALPLGDEDPLDDDLPDAVLGRPGLADAARERRLLERALHAAEEAARAESKIARLRRLLSRVREPVIVFTEYRDTLSRLRQALSRLGIRPSVLHGGQGAAERDNVQQQFNASGGVLLATDAAAEGLNLHKTCRFVVHFELPWSPGRLEQRAGRVDRIGQHRRVHETALVASDTAERLVLVPLARRIARARHDLGASPQALSHLSEAAVAAAVLDGAVVDQGDRGAAAPGCYVEAPAALSRSAATEAERLMVLRSWRSGIRPGRRHRHSLPIATVRTSRMPDGLIVVYVVSLTSGAGRLLHSELVAVHARATSKGLPRRAADARREAADALRREGARMRQVVEHLMSARLDEIAAAQREAAGRMAARERALVERYASASRQLLQAGLFDTRALNDRQRRLRSRFNSAADSDRRIGELADSPRKRLLEPVAVLHAGRPTHRR